MDKFAFNIYRPSVGIKEKHVCQGVEGFGMALEVCLPMGFGKKPPQKIQGDVLIIKTTRKWPILHTKWH